MVLRGKQHTVWIPNKIPIEDFLGHVDINPVESDSRKNEVEK